MHDSFRVERVKRGEHVADYLPGLAFRYRSYNRMEQVHRVERVFALGLQNVYADDSRMRELREAASLGYEPPA